jgi:hypothetical protein
MPEAIELRTKVKVVTDWDDFVKPHEMAHFEWFEFALSSSLSFSGHVLCVVLCCVALRCALLFCFALCVVLCCGMFCCVALSGLSLSLSLSLSLNLSLSLSLSLSTGVVFNLVSSCLFLFLLQISCLPPGQWI